MRPFYIWSSLVALTSISVPGMASTRPVPPACNAEVNAGLLNFLGQQQGGHGADEDNVMVCGTLVRNGFSQHAGHSNTGSHEVLIVAAPTATGSVLVEVVTNDSLDGKVTGSKGDAIFAYGQAYVDAKPIRAQGLTLAGGLHETHCATHVGTDDGWVVIAGRRYPSGSCARAR